MFARIPRTFLGVKAQSNRWTACGGPADPVLRRGHGGRHGSPFLIESLESRIFMDGRHIVCGSGELRRANNGTSWANAYLNLAIRLSISCSKPRRRHLRGRLLPWKLPKGRMFRRRGRIQTATFQLIDNVAIEGDLRVRPIPRTRNIAGGFRTILSGDIGEIGNISDNSHHVVTGSGTDAPTADLDGVTVSGGNAAGTGVNQADGGGMLVISGHPTVNNCSFINDTAGGAGGSGGGIYAASSSSLAITNCSFTNDSAVSGGGVFDNFLFHAGADELLVHETIPRPFRAEACITRVPTRQVCRTVHLPQTPRRAAPASKTLGLAAS